MIEWSLQETLQGFWALSDVMAHQVEAPLYAQYTARLYTATAAWWSRWGGEIV